MRRLTVLVAAATLASSAHAECTVTATGDPAQIAYAQSLAANSDDPQVRAAYANHRCNIRKLLHGGGRLCLRGLARDHVTVRVFGEATYHVFPARLTDGHFCTTR